MADLLSELRDACRAVAARARSVSVVRQAVAGFAAGLPIEASEGLPAPHPLEGSAEELAAFWLTLDAINFGSGWFPTLRKREGRSGYLTIAAGVRGRFATRGPWSAEGLARMQAAEIAAALGQDDSHELMELFARSLNDLGARIAADAADRSAASLVAMLAGWDSFADVSIYSGFEVPFLKRAQIAAADLARAGVGGLRKLERLTMFADNLVPHVLRLDGILEYDPKLAARIERGELVEHGSPEEVEIRACALHAVELIVAERSDTSAAEVDQLLWSRGQGAAYKALPRHRSRCTAY